MKKKITLVLITIIAVLVTACGQTAGNTDNSEEISELNEENDDIKQEPEKTANVIDEIWLNNYEKEYINSEDYNALFSERCFYVKGVRVHIPTTVRGFEKLFGTTFTTATSGLYDTVYKDDNDHVLEVEFKREDKDSLSGDSDYYEELKDIPIMGFYCDITPYGETHCILNVNNVTYESVLPEGKECANDYGYVNVSYTDHVIYRFYPDCYQAYYLFLKGELSQEYIDDGINEFISTPTDIRYSDVTLDGLDEMFCFIENEAYIFTYDAVDRKLRNIYYTDEGDCLSTEDGILICTYDPKGSQDYYERTRYYVFNRYGKKWELAELERWQDENYDTHHLKNGEEVDKDTYNIALDLYGYIGAVHTFGIDLMVWGIRTNDRSSKYEMIMSHKEKLEPDLTRVGYDPDAINDGKVNGDENEESIDGDYDTLRTALIDAGFDVDTYGLEGFEVVVSAPDGYVNVREGCGLEYNIVTQIDNGAQFYISDCHVDSSGILWGAISEPEFIGYIALSQVKQVK